MRKLLFIGFFWAFANVEGQTLDAEITVENVPAPVQQHLEAMNQAALRNVGSLTITGSFQQGETRFDLKIFKARPGKWRQEISLKSQKQIVVVTEQSGWEINHFSGSDQPIVYSEHKVLDLAASASIDSKLWFELVNGSGFEVVGEELLDGRQARKVKVRPSKGSPSFVWIDQAGYVIRSETPASGYSLHYLAYQEVEGILFPKHVQLETPGNNAEFHFEEITLNPSLDPAIFELPQVKSTEEIAREYLKAFYDLDYKALANYYTDKSLWLDPSTKVINPDPDYVVPGSVGGSRIISDLQTGFAGVFDASYRFEKSFYSAGFAVIYGSYNYKIPARYFIGLAHSEKIFEFTLPMNTILTIRDGKVLEHREYGDWASWQRQALAQSKE